MRESPSSRDELPEQAEWLSRLANRVVGDEHAAADAVQDTCVAYLERAPSALRTPRSWLARVLVRAARRSGRSEDRRRDRETRHGSNDASPSTAELVEQLENQRRLGDAVRSLPESYREVVWQRYYEGREPREIAAALLLEAGTVRTRLSRALDMLRKRLQEERVPCPSQRSRMGALGAWLGGTIVTTKITAGVLGAALVVAALVWSARKDEEKQPVSGVPAIEEHEESALGGADPLEIIRRGELSEAVVDSSSSAPEERAARTSHLRVRVLDADGGPARSVAVELRWVGESVEDVLTLVSVASDEGGHAELNEVMGLCRTHLASIAASTPADTAHFAVGAALPGLFVPAPPLSLDSLPVETLTIHLPATGQLRVRIENVPSFAVGHASFRFDVREDALSPWSRASDWIADAGSQMWHVSHLPLGLEVRVMANMSDGSAPYVQDELAGPSSAGEEVHAVLRFDDPYPRLIGRVLDERGAPFANRQLRARRLDPLAGQIRLRDGMRMILAEESPQDLRTDDQGRFSLSMSTIPSESGWNLVLEVEGDSSRIARWSFPEVIAVPVHDAGDLSLCPMAIIAKGHVVDASGQGVADAIVEVRTQPRVGADTPLWLERAELRSRCDAQGAFEIRGELGDDSLELTAHKAKWVMREPTVALPGSNALRLVLESAGWIEGQVEFLGEIPPDQLVAVLSHSGEQPGHDGPTMISVDTGGRFRSEGLPSGRYDVEIARYFPGFGKTYEIVHFEYVSVPGGAAADDPRLKRIDLNEHLRSFALRLRRADGRALRSEYLALNLGCAIEREEPRFFLPPARDGRVSFLAPRDCESVEIRVAGFQPVTFPWHAEEQDVLLHAGWSVLVDASPQVREWIAEGKADVSLVESPDDPSFSSRSAAQVRFKLRSGAPTPAFATRPGRYRVLWFVLSGDERGSVGRTIDVAAPQYIEIQGPLTNVRIEAPEELLERFGR